MTRNPTAEWLARQITEAFPWDSAPKYLVRDNDRAFGAAFKARVRAIGIRASRFTAACFGFLILSQSGERSERRGTFSCPARLSHITGSGPNQADRRGDLILFTPTQEIALAPEPLLTFTCPKTKDRTPTRVETDAQTLCASWKSRLLVKCPSCGGMHEISVRDAYLNGAVDVVGPSDRQRVRRKSKPG